MCVEVAELGNKALVSCYIHKVPATEESSSRQQRGKVQAKVSSKMMPFPPEEFDHTHKNSQSSV